ncbi:hypothetical protein ZYGR_0A00350 [Zygosaccharomyces rouxii]|uniref:Uncharacterized protein n=1 Tax=Zygosaccharomyces rouxii TaxID=4956 RepID=A0A1Q2ZSU8_ZYGRO|nr:hypothetical protein ZYGR_0A00350 [Zygosaccharomyces rouxii]
MAFKSFKYKFYTKGYHSASQKPATAFFDSSYQYLRQNQGLVAVDSAVPPSHLPHLGPHPVIGANVNFNIVDDVLQDYETADERREEQLREQYENNGNVNQHSHQRESKGSNTDTYNGRRQRSASISSHHQTRSPAALRRRSMGENTATLSLRTGAKDAFIDHTLSQRYYSTTNTSRKESDIHSHYRIPPESQPVVPAGKDAKVAADNVAKEDNVVDNGRPAQLDQQFLSKQRDSMSPWEEDKEPCLNKDTFLRTHTDQINKCYENGDLNSINSLYQALKRNDIIPPLKVYEQILDSVARRQFDNDDLDYKIAELLTCYQDLIMNRLKPSDRIYNTVLECLFKASIAAYVTHNSNGVDFYKIAAELFHTIGGGSHLLSKSVLDHALLAMNLFPGHMSLVQAQRILDKNSNAKSDSFYYVALLSYAKTMNDPGAIKSLYEEYRLALSSDPLLKEGEFEVYSMTVSGLVETGELELAIKLLDRLMQDLRNVSGSSENVSLLLSNFLLSVSKLNCHKAYNLWAQFHKLKWVPEFSYEFYLVLMANSFEDWKLTKKIYSCLYPMKCQFRGNHRNKLSEYLLYPMGVESVLSSLMDYSLQLKDSEIIMKLIEESIIKKFRFDTALYPFIFAYLKEIRCPDEYLLRFVKAQGNVIKDAESISNVEKYDFLNGIVQHFPSQVILKKVTEMEFFVDLCRNLNLSDSRVVNYGGLIGCMTSLWGSPQTIDKYAFNMEIHAILITKLYDFDTYCSELDNDSLAEFREKTMERFSKLATNYKRLNLDPAKVPGVVVQAIKLTNVAEDVMAFYNHPGDWDKSYHLSLGSVIRNSVRTGIKEYQKLLLEGYCFDYDTYKELISAKFVDSHIIKSSLELCPDKEEQKYLTNLTVIRAPHDKLQDLVLLNPQFSSQILPFLKDESLLRLAKNADIYKWIEVTDFPKAFMSIAVQAEYKASIEYIYSQLYQLKDYETILQFNKSCPVLDMEILLKSCIRCGEYTQYNQLFEKFKDHLGSSSIDIQSEYLINNGQVDEAVHLINSANAKTPHKTLDLYTFGLFLQSFTREIGYYDAPENTLQLANLLSTQSTFSGMLALYDIVSHTEPFNVGESAKSAVKAELLEQMLNNIQDAINFVDVENEDIRDEFLLKLQNFFRFKVFLKQPFVTLNDMKKLLDIWQNVNPYAIDTLFNNMVESIYLNPSAQSLYLENDLMFHYNSDSLLELTNEIENFYANKEDSEAVDKIRRFKSVMNENKL